MWLKAREMRRRDVEKMQKLKEMEGCTFQPRFLTSEKTRQLGTTFVVSSIRKNDNSLSLEKYGRSVVTFSHIIKK